jgi:molybdopterin-guanine dinucleotide biosynthesis protein A
VSAAPLAAVLAGGRSRRMGSPKALASLAGAPLIHRPLAAAAAAGLEVVVVAKAGSPLPADLAAPVWHEPDEPAHPLTGLVAALERAGERPLVAIACDMPFVAAGLLGALARMDAAVAVPRVAGRLEPFPGRYTAAALPVLRAALAREAPVRAALAELDPVVLGEAALRAFGDPVALVAGVNTPAELAAAERALA